MAEKTNGNGELGYQAPAVERCLMILELLAKHSDGMTLSDIVAALNLPKNGVFRVTMTLLKAGYLNRDEKSMRFTLSKKILMLGHAAVGDEALIEKSRDIMNSLREVTKETVCIGTMIGSEGTILEQVLSLHPFKFALEIGWRFPLYAGSPGKAMLAFLPDMERERIIEGLTIHKFTENTITDKDELRKELQKIRECGFALDPGEGWLECHCVGAPILDHNNYPIAAIWTTGPSERMPLSFLEEISPVVVEHAASISERLGHGVMKSEMRVAG